MISKLIVSIHRLNQLIEQKLAFFKKLRFRVAIYLSIIENSVKLVKSYKTL